MLELDAALLAFGAMLALSLAGWIASVVLRDVSIVDSLWSLFFLVGTVVYARVVLATWDDARVILLVALVAAWALRLAGYLTWRNWGEPEDRRYAAMRASRGPSFAWRSLYVVFLLQATLAAVIAMPLFVAVNDFSPLGAWDYAGVALWVVGFGFEAIGDWQLARFKSDPRNTGRVLDTGLWRYTRHPNYFGEATLWWGYYLIAVGAGGAWTVFAPLLMTVLLLKVSGVSLLERDIHERRPAYRAYVQRTNAFLPWPPRAGA